MSLAASSAVVDWAPAIEVGLVGAAVRRRDRALALAA